VRDAPPVLVFGSGVTALGIIRSLGQAGIPAYVVSDARDVVARSRWYRPAPASAARATPEQDLPAWLAGLPLARAVLLPAGDSWALALARHAAQVAPRFVTSSAPEAVLDRLMDKWHLAETLRAAAVAHPRTAVLETSADLDAIPEASFAGSFLKPRDSQRFFARFGVKGFHVRSRAEAAERLRMLAPLGLAVQLQEYIPGPATAYHFVDGFFDGQGQVSAVFARQRLRIYPPDFGNSSYMVSEAVTDAEDAVVAVTRLLRHVGYRGIFSAEFKRDERDGVFKLLEVNVRPWWYVEFAERCGVNVCRMAYQDALGEPVEPVTRYAVGRTCVYPYYDFYACRDLRRRGQLSPIAWAKSWLASMQPVFRWNDPLPALTELATIVSRRLRRGAGGKGNRG
jgi:D-aspartate ligase